MVFGARKWLVDLQRQCELFALIVSSMPSNTDHSGQIYLRFTSSYIYVLYIYLCYIFPALPPSGKKSIVKLAQRMTRSFCTGVCSTVHKWEVVQNSENTKVMMRKSVGNSGEPPGVILSATTTIWLPVSPHDLLEFLQNAKTRAHWDVLSQDGPMQQMLRIPKGQDLGNSICLLTTNVSDILQDYIFIYLFCF